MILRVGPFLYRVHFVEGYILHEGQRCLGLCDNDAHEIHVSTRTSLAQQVQVISHEYMEAWIYHFGQNLTGKEDYCDLFGVAMAQFVLDLTHQLHAFAHCDTGEPPPPPPDDPPSGREAVATKLAAAVARVGLRATRVFDPEGLEPPRHQDHQECKRKPQMHTDAHR